jgi:uncharacterized protein YndB with AHSA1/START domain
MTTITHHITIDASISEVYEVLGTLGGLRSWFTTAINGDPERDGKLTLGFGDTKELSITVTDAKKNKWIIWTVTGSNFAAGKEWVDTQISFRLLEGKNRDTSVDFEHARWKDDSKLKAAAVLQWELSLASLKKLCESGRGEPESPKRTATKKIRGWFPVT